MREAGAGLSRDVSATIPPSVASFNSICFFRETEIMMFRRRSKPLSCLIKVWQERELGWLSRLRCLGFGGGKALLRSRCLCDTTESEDQERSG